MIAALFVQTNGAYFGLPDVDPWDEKRDARLYDGDDPVIAHPPCDRWGRFWFGGPSVKVRRKLGDDGGCFRAALRAVRLNGGVLEHPEASHAWKHFGLKKPPKKGGWVVADYYGFTCCVEQGHYGHRARKVTWLYVVRTSLPELIWGSSGPRMRLDQGYHSKEERAAAVANGTHQPVKRIGKRENEATPTAFRDLLLSIARSAK